MIAVNTEFICGEVGCMALGMAFIATILLLVVMGWLYELWREWAIEYLEEIERDIERSHHTKATDEHEEDEAA